MTTTIEQRQVSISLTSEYTYSRRWDITTNDGMIFKVIDYSPSDICKEYPLMLYRMTDRLDLNYHKAGGTFYKFGDFETLKNVEDFLLAFDETPRHDVPQVNDVIIVNHDRWYARKKGEYMRIEYRGEENAVSACCGYNPSSFFVPTHKGGKKSTGSSISGGPWKYVNISELKDTGIIDNVVCWAWGMNGAGANQGVFYSIPAKVWQWD